MSRNGDNPDEPRTNRRALLGGITTAAAGVALGTGAAMAAVDTESHCWYEYDCLAYDCPEGGQSYVRRHCCEDPDTGDTECTDWEYVGCC